MKTEKGTINLGTAFGSHANFLISFVVHCPSGRNVFLVVIPEKPGQGSGRGLYQESSTNLTATLAKMQQYGYIYLMASKYIPNRLKNWTGFDANNL